MTCWRSLATVTPSASPIAGSAGSIESMASAFSAITIAIITTISRSPGRLRWGDWAGLCMAAAYAPKPSLWIAPKAKGHCYATQKGRLVQTALRIFVAGGSALARAGHRHRTEGTGLDRAGQRVA